MRPVNDLETSAIRIPTLFFGIGTPNRRANVGARSTWRRERKYWENNRIQNHHHIMKPFPNKTEVVPVLEKVLSLVGKLCDIRI